MGNTPTKPDQILIPPSFYPRPRLHSLVYSPPFATFLAARERRALFSDFVARGVHGCACMSPEDGAMVDVGLGVDYDAMYRDLVQPPPARGGAVAAPPPAKGADPPATPASGVGGGGEGVRATGRLAVRMEDVVQTGPAHDPSGVYVTAEMRAAGNGNLGLRAAALHNESRIGAFAICDTPAETLAQPAGARIALRRSLVGVRASTPMASVGVAAAPFRFADGPALPASPVTLGSPTSEGWGDAPATAWTALRLGKLALAGQVYLQGYNLAEGTVSTASRAGVSYRIRSATSARPAFEAGLVATRRGPHDLELTASAYAHRVMQRAVYNPMEESHVKGIANAVDIGVEVSQRVIGNPNANPGEETLTGEGGMRFRVGAAWQVNSSLQVKAQASTEEACATAVLRRWSTPRVTLASTLGVQYSGPARGPFLGISLSVEQTPGGDVQYEAPDADQAVEDVVVTKYAVGNLAPERSEVTAEDVAVAARRRAENAEDIGTPRGTAGRLSAVRDLRDSWDGLM